MPVIVQDEAACDEKRRKMMEKLEQECVRVRGEKSKED